MLKRYKLIIILFISFFVTIALYFLFYKPKITFVSIYQDSHNYSYSDYFSSKYDAILIKDKYLTNNNIQYYLDEKGYEIKNAKFVTIELGNELYNYKILNNEIINTFLNDCQSIIKHVEALNENYFIINLYNNGFIDQKLSLYIKEGHYIKYSLISDYLIKYNDLVFLDYKGNRFIYEYLTEKLL